MAPEPPEARPRRLFVAVEVPGRAQDAIDVTLASWRDVLPSARWSPRGNRHVTVRFLGRVEPSLAGPVTAAVAATAAAAAPFDLALAGLGGFPERGKARVLWVGLGDPAGALGALAASLQDHLPPGFEPETRRYHAHLTVARSDPPLAVPQGWRPTDVEPADWRVTELVLFESHLRRPHAVYEPVARFGLGDVADHRPTQDDGRPMRPGGGEEGT